MTLPQDSIFLRRIDWRRHLKALFGAVGMAVGVGLFFGLTIFALNVIYHWVSGEPANWLPTAVLVAFYGAAASFAMWFKGYIGAPASENDGRLVSYLRVAIPTALEPLVLVLVFMAIGDLFVPIEKTALLFVLACGLTIGVACGFIAVCNRAYRRHEFLLMVLFGFALRGAFVGGSSLYMVAIGWLEWRYRTLPTWDWTPTLYIVGAILGIVFELWRNFARPRGWTAIVTIGSAIGLIANTTSRGKLLVIGLWWTAVGALCLTLAWFYALDDFKPEAATLHWGAVAVWGTVGVYFMFARGLSVSLGHLGTSAFTSWGAGADKSVSVCAAKQPQQTAAGRCASFAARL